MFECSDASRLRGPLVCRALKVLPMSAGALVSTYAGHTERVTAVKFSPVSTNIFASVSRDGLLIMWVSGVPFLKRFTMAQGGCLACGYFCFSLWSHVHTDTRRRTLWLQGKGAQDQIVPP